MDIPVESEDEGEKDNDNRAQQGRECIRAADPLSDPSDKDDVNNGTQ